MITHEIIVNDPYDNFKPFHSPYALSLKTKLGFADYLNCLHIKKGWYVIRTGVGATYPYRIEDYWRVKDIQEIHLLCEYHEHTGMPLCINIVNKKGDSLWVSQDAVFQCHAPKQEGWFDVEGL